MYKPIVTSQENTSTDINFFYLYPLTLAAILSYSAACSFNLLFYINRRVLQLPPSLCLSEVSIIGWLLDRTNGPCW